MKICVFANPGNHLRPQLRPKIQITTVNNENDTDNYQSQINNVYRGFLFKVLLFLKVKVEKTF